jgi:GDP-L-fucose synthase
MTNLLDDFPIHFPNEISEKLLGKKAIVTGGTGMIGREVVRLLMDHGCSVTSISLDDLALDPRVSYVKGDLSDLKFCLDICSGVDYVFHVAGIKGSVVVTKEKPASFFVPLLMMNTNILEAARRNKVEKVLYTSSIGAYSPSEIFMESTDDINIPPMDMFPGWAKRMAEMQIDAYRIQYGMMNFSIVRPSNIYGPGDNFDEKNAMVIPSLISRVSRGDNPVQIWGNGSSERDFLHATDAAIGIIYACIRGTDGKPINLGCGYGITIKELVETLQMITTFEAFFDVSKPSGFPKRVMDMSLAKSKIGFVPHITLEMGLRQVWKWFQTNKNEHLSKQNYFN